ncbi:unnamed protein product, partial [Mesorhabditis belari]|uniref:C6 domain-containing protein n=1 Tax=Mesorhabditis belari TaxID=2138241 RepID=A0AAF3J4H4_9BILA
MIAILILVFPLVLGQTTCDLCPTTKPIVQTGGPQMTAFTRNAVIGKNKNGCLVKNLTCTSNTAGFMPVISFNDDKNGVWESKTQTGSIQLVCNANKYWTFTLNGVTIQIDQVACLGDFKNVA